MLVRRLKLVEIDEFYEHIVRLGSAPEGIILGYIWESVKIPYFDICYSSFKKNKYDSAVYVYRIENTLCIEEWKQGKSFNNLIVSLIKGEKRVKINVGDKVYGSIRKWRLIDEALEMRLKLGPINQCGQGRDYQEEDERLATQLLFEEWWTEKEAKEALRVWGNNPRSQTSVIQIDNKLAAFSHASFDRKYKKAWMSVMYVAKEFRGRKLGTKVLNHLCNKIYYQGIRELYLGVDKSNKGAVSFYNKLGFELTYWKKYKYQVK